LDKAEIRYINNVSPAIPHSTAASVPMLTEWRKENDGSLPKQR
jgi:hypothetical protein